MSGKYQNQWWSSSLSRAIYILSYSIDDNGFLIFVDGQVSITQPTSSPYTVQGGDGIRVCFQCTPSNGYRVVGWNHNNTRLVSSDRISLEMDNKDLCISDLNPRDLGDYTCIGNNNAGQTRTASFVLMVTCKYLKTI